MYCYQCGKQLTDPNAKFCTGCGASIRVANAPQPQASAVSQSPPAAPATTDWSAFFQSLGSDLLRVNQTAPNRFEFEGETKVKALLSRTTIRYQAVAALDPDSRSIQWWEKLSESGLGIAPTDFGVTAQTRSQKGAAVTIAKSVRTAGGGYTYRYGDLRAVVEQEARRSGWDLRVAVRRP
ncbi:MAG: zinc ribbon domain-containing protein [Kiritimatiellae bacterium]|nr:zinc ribbon domain-containing protein [Kiritimatiellia bacterium]